MPLDETATIPSSPREPSPGLISDIDRYSRQILFPGIRESGQLKLARSHAAIVGCGATGAASASLLARAGVGTLSLIDRDFVEPSNLQRQVLFDEADARDSLPKAEAARRHIANFNGTTTVHSHIADLVPGNIADLLASADIILDATDNFETRYLINDFAVQRSIPWIYAAAIGGYAATMNILPAPRHAQRAALPPYAPTACLACIFPKPPSGNVDTCDTAGILSTAVNLAASLQVTEALKFLTGQPHLMRRTLLSVELWSPTAAKRLDHSEISASDPRPDCEVCAQRIFTHLSGTNRPHITLCGRDSVQIHEHHRPTDFAALTARLSQHADIEGLRSNNLLLRFRRGPHTLTVFADGRALIQGTTDITIARSLYARFIGA
ncbi:MAG TPA: ThiF family adenylyltransferase [Acidobacteriaceae bacterium]|nr:ThiF family adenylyltransferase [Acidobacteriaceae bacterium]